jgi:hypothetical protein
MEPIEIGVRVTYRYSGHPEGPGRAWSGHEATVTDFLGTTSEIYEICFDNGARTAAFRHELAEITKAPKETS